MAQLVRVCGDEPLARLDDARTLKSALQIPSSCPPQLCYSACTPPLLQSDGYNHELFVLMMGTVRPGDTLFASLLFFQPLTFENGHYTLELPT